MKIEIAKASDLTSFFQYISNQLLNNGRFGQALFQPISREQTELSVSERQRFVLGVKTAVGEPGWRCLWLAKDEAGQILGHIDLRPYDEIYCQHRVQLGMGVDRHFRQQGIARQLLTHVISYCHKNDWIEWLDLGVLTNNLVAKQLYLKMGFHITGEIEDRYRIDGESISEISMSMATRGEGIFTK